MERFGPTRRGGPVFRWLGEPLAIDLANTVMVVSPGETVDLLASPAELENWLELERPRLGECGFALDSLDRVHELRADIRALLAATAGGEPLPGRALARVNATSAAAPVSPRLEIGAGGVARLSEDPERAEDLAGLLGFPARSALRLVADHSREPIQVCQAPSCGMFFLGRRRWCCSACGNRARAARHYRRQRGVVVADN